MHECCIHACMSWALATIHKLLQTIAVIQTDVHRGTSHFATVCCATVAAVVINKMSHYSQSSVCLQTGFLFPCFPFSPILYAPLLNAHCLLPVIRNSSLPHFLSIHFPIMLFIHSPIMQLIFPSCHSLYTI